MALTMTRTRTQKALNKLAGMVADIHGELEFVELCLSPAEGADEAAKAAREARRVRLLADREALYVTLRQFDPSIDPPLIAARVLTRREVTRLRKAIATNLGP